MASLRRHHRSPYIVACFTGINGARYQRSTKVIWDGRIESRRKAQKIADEFEDVARGIRTAKQVQKVVQELFQQATGKELEMPSVRSFAAEWLGTKKGAIEARTLHFYRVRLESLLRQLGPKADASLNLISEKDIRDWRDQEARRVSPSTVNLGLVVLRMFLGAAVKANVVGENMAARVSPLKKKPASGRRPFTVPELKRLLPVLSPEWRSLVFFGLYTGQRLGDLARLRWRNIDLAAGEIRFLSKKTGRAQKIPIAPPLLAFLQTLDVSSRNGDAPVHPASAGIAGTGRNGDISTLSRQFRFFLGKAGLVPPIERRKGKGKPAGSSPSGAGRRTNSPLSFHALRHTLTSLLKNAGVSSAVAEEIIGHESSAMNRIYTHIDQASLAKAMAQLPSLE